MYTVLHKTFSAENMQKYEFLLLAVTAIWILFYIIQIKLECGNECFVKRLVSLKLYQWSFIVSKLWHFLTTFNSSKLQRDKTCSLKIKCLKETRIYHFGVTSKNQAVNEPTHRISSNNSDINTDIFH